MQNLLIDIFNPSDYVQSIIDKFINKYNINFMNTCAIYYRGTDKITEQKLLHLNT